jgi:transcriptional regulator with XRE-family HTH domain
MSNNKIKELREKHKMTQEELANILNISKGYMSQIEIGERTPSLKILKQLSKLFSVPLDFIVFDKATMDNSEIPEPIRVFFRTETLSDEDIDELESLFKWWKEQRSKRE